MGHDRWPRAVHASESLNWNIRPYVHPMSGKEGSGMICPRRFPPSSWCWRWDPPLGLGLELLWEVSAPQTPASLRRKRSPDNSCQLRGGKKCYFERKKKQKNTKTRSATPQTRTGFNLGKYDQIFPAVWEKLQHFSFWDHGGEIKTWLPGWLYNQRMALITYTYFRVSR